MCNQFKANGTSYWGVETDKIYMGIELRQNNKIEESKWRMPSTRKSRKNHPFN
jgi:hypothetical protein